MLLHIGLCAISLFMLLKGADFLVDGASRLAKHLGVAPVIIGVTVVALGTTMPELSVSLLASLEGNGEIAVGNAVGSIITNIGLVLALAALISPIRLKEVTRKHELPLMVLAVVLLMILSFDFISGPRSEMFLSRSDGIIMVGGFFIFLYYMFQRTKKHKKGGLEKEIIIKENVKNRKNPWTYVLLIILGIAGVAIGGKLIVDSAVFIARSIGITEAAISLTLLAAGTSLPEITTVIVAAAKRQSDIAMGDIIGSNIFNVVYVLGFSALVATVSIPSFFIVDMVVALFFVVLLVPMFATDRRLSKAEGALLLMMYIGYIVYIVLR